mmetsp:Transcript_25738/g.74466  ORF Transcript_25738/g.74466 Transcript_25738/m.74466 type:complete len:232 (+) Transcript_25738:898-1593(+)
MVSSLQHMVLLQSSPALLHFVLTQGATLCSTPPRAMPGVLAPIAVQFHGTGSASESSGPGRQCSMHMPKFCVFKKHCMPGSAQQRESLQLSKPLAHFLATQGATLPPGAGGTPGEREPRALQAQGFGFRSIGSGPGMHSPLHAAQPGSLRKHWAPTVLQQRVSLQSSLGPEQFALAQSAIQMSLGLGSGALPGVRLPRASQVQCTGSVSRTLGPGTHSSWQTAQVLFLSFA